MLREMRVAFYYLLQHPVCTPSFQGPARVLLHRSLSHKASKEQQPASYTKQKIDMGFVAFTP